MAIGPISPDQIGEAQAAALPEEVFKVVNNHIALGWCNTYAQVTQEEVITDLLKELGWNPDTDRQAIFDHGYLNFEEAYRSQGWVVKYDKPAYNESYGAFWTFKRKQ